ncbi:ComEC/Rec2 family competence protein [Haloplasma contractile]|uniref:S-layer protein n=1 Tax=Haloplasma contractile SSD-17B TaxID=1033810 RepID=U2FLN8_9MOLU|nr:ComEC/Rec2 family competence protein [Haloplasma contractile]ERJ12104.1 Putative S-layer protein [Haloplasma contractile SSD-17B]
MKKVIFMLCVISLTVTLTACSLQDINEHPLHTTTSDNEKHQQLNNLEEVTIHFIDVGQGDATLIVYKDYHILIDAGNNWYGDDVVEYLTKYQVDDIELLIGTHPDADHIGGLDDVLSHFDVELIIDSCKDHTTETWNDYYSAILNETTANSERLCDSDLEYIIDEDVIFQVIETGDDYTDKNENSVLTKLSIGDLDVLFTADIEERIEQMILEHDIEAEILKVGHHGSKTSSSSDFLKKVDPEIAIISAGRNNRYGHPHLEVINRLDDYTNKIYGTWHSGDIILSINDGQYTINTDQTITDNDENSDQGTSEVVPITLLNLTEFVKPLDKGSITIDGEPNMEYDIDVIYSSGPSSASGLENKVSNEEGVVTWEWIIGSRVSPGIYQIEISNGQVTNTYEFEVYK